MKNLNEPLSVRVPASLKERLRIVADGRSMAFIVVRALAEFVEREEARQ